MKKIRPQDSERLGVLIKKTAPVVRTGTVMYISKHNETRSLQE